MENTGTSLIRYQLGRGSKFEISCKELSAPCPGGVTTNIRQVASFKIHEDLGQFGVRGASRRCHGPAKHNSRA